VAIIPVLSDAELAPELNGNIEIVDAETGQRRKIGATDEALASYHEHLRRWQLGIRDNCRALGVRYVPVTAGTPVETVMVADLRRHGLLE
jgi:hypothetical protein